MVPPLVALSGRASTTDGPIGADAPVTIRRHNKSMTSLSDLSDAIKQSRQQPSTALKDSLLLGFDTETTGVSPSDAIVSASLVLRDPAKGFDGDVRADWVINPHRPISAAASAVNGFTNEYLQEHGQEPTRALDQIATIVARAQNRSIPLLAYNAPFDVQMLQRGLEHWKLDGLGARVHALDLLIVDPLVIDRAISRRHGKRTLTDTTQYYQVRPHGDFHDASTDTIAALDLVAPMCEASSEVAQLPVSSLMDWQRQAHKKWADQFNEWLASRGRRQIPTEWM